MEVVEAIRIAQAFNISLSVRGGGHGYTCQGAKAGGIMLDMRQLKGIEIHNNDNNNNCDHNIQNDVDGKNAHAGELSMTVGTGYTWGEILKYIKKIDIPLKISKTDISKIILNIKEI